MTRRDLMQLPAIPLLKAGGVSIVKDFPGGSAGLVQTVAADHLRIGIKGQADQSGRNRQASWYYFRVVGARPKKPLTIDLVDLPGEYNFAANRGAITQDTRPYMVEKGVWVEAPGVYDPGEPKWRLSITPNKSSFYLAHLPPYRLRNLSMLKQALKPQVEIIGKSVGGRPLELWSFENGGPAAPTAWIMFRQHAWEAGTSWAGEGFLRNLPAGVNWKILPLNDPDGVAEGGVRFNRNGFDLNRNWDAPDDPLLRPEIYAQKSAIEKWLAAGKKIDLFLSLHNTETGEYLEGPEGNPGAALFERLKRETTFDPDRDYFTRMDVAGPGRANVIQYLWAKHKIAATLMELRIAASKKLGARPNPESWRAFGKQLAEAIAAVLKENR